MNTNDIDTVDMPADFWEKAEAEAGERLKKLRARNNRFDTSPPVIPYDEMTVTVDL